MADNIKYRPDSYTTGVKERIYGVYGNNATAFFNGQYANGGFQHHDKNSAHIHTGPLAIIQNIINSPVFFVKK